MGYFDDCTFDERFRSNGGGTSIYGGAGSLREVRDFNQRNSISVATSWLETEESFILEALFVNIDEIPPDAVLVEVGPGGEHVRHSRNL